MLLKSPRPSSGPRKVRAIYQDKRKSDQRDALMLARIGWMDRALLYPVRHGREEAQQDLSRIKLRGSLVRARVGLINTVRLLLSLWKNQTVYQPYPANH